MFRLDDDLDVERRKQAFIMQVSGLRPAICMEEEDDVAALSPLEPKANKTVKNSFGVERVTTNPSDSGMIKINEIFPQEIFPAKPQFGGDYNFKPTEEDLKMLEGTIEWPGIKREFGFKDSIL